MQYEAQAVASHRRATKTNGVRNLLARARLGETDPGVTELPILVPSEQEAALEAAAHAQGLTVAQLSRLLIRQFLDGASGNGLPAAMIRTKYGRQFFETTEEFLGFQRGCPHPSARWVHGGCHDHFVCERCWKVLDEGWPDHHPAISRWLNEGGASAREGVEK